MTTVEALVQSYYGRSDLLQRIEARLRSVGVDPPCGWSTEDGARGACGLPRGAPQRSPAMVGRQAPRRIGRA